LTRSLMAMQTLDLWSLVRSRPQIDPQDLADAVVSQAVAAGATSKGPVEDKPYGRSGGVVDPYGLTWWICS